MLPSSQCQAQIGQSSWLSKYCQPHLRERASRSPFFGVLSRYRHVTLSMNKTANSTSAS